MESNEIRSLFGKNDIIESLKDKKQLKYSGFLTVVGYEPKRTGYDSFNKELIVYKDGVVARVIEKGIDQEAIDWNNHVNNVLRTCKRLGCSSWELLNMNYVEELKK